MLISASGEALIADFGLSFVMDGNRNTSYSTEFKRGGNMGWMAPELLQEIAVPRSPQTDVFSFGRMIVEVSSPPKSLLSI